MKSCALCEVWDRGWTRKDCSERRVGDWRWSSVNSWEPIWGSNFLVGGPDSWAHFTSVFVGPGLKICLPRDNTTTFPANVDRPLSDLVLQQRSSLCEDAKRALLWTPRRRVNYGRLSTPQVLNCGVGPRRSPYSDVTRGERVSSRSENQLQLGPLKLNLDP